MTIQDSFDAELERWFDRQDPPRSAEHLVEPILSTVAVTDQRGSRQWIGVALTMAAAAVLVGVFLARGLLPAPVGGPDVAPPPESSRSRLPEGTVTIPIGVPWDRPLGAITLTPSTTWVEIHHANVLIDRATNTEIGRVPGAYVPAYGGGFVWAFVDLQREAPECCPPGILTALDPATGEELRQLPGVTGHRIALDGANAWVTDEQTLRHVDLSSGEILATVDLPDGRMQPIVAHESVWVLGSDELYRIDPASASVIATIEIATAQEAVASADAIWVKTDPGDVWAVTDEESTLVRVDPDRNQVVATLRGFGLQKSFGGLMVADGLVWTPSPGGLTRVDPATNEIADVTTLPWDNFWGIAVDDGELWLSGDHTQQVHRIPVSSIGR
jgi:hypothetical protein